MGIAAGVDIEYSHVPRAVKRLQSDGLISEVVAHTMTNPTGRRRKSYFLTDSGLQVAHRLLTNISETKTNDIKDFGGGAGIKRTFPPSNRSTGSVVVGAIYERAHKLGYKVLLKPGEYPLVSDFIDRKDEINYLSNAFTSTNKNAIIITGPEGIGKSSLLAQAIKQVFYQNLENTKPRSKQLPDIFWLDVSAIRTEIELFTILGNLFGVKDIQEFEKPIKALASRGSIIILDGLDLADNGSELPDKEAEAFMDELEMCEDLKIHRPHGFITNLIDVFQKSSTTISNLKFIITTTFPIDRSEEITILEVGGFGLEHVKELLGPRFTLEEASLLYHHTDGNPRIIRAITEIDDSKLDGLKGLTIEERAMAIIILAWEMLEKK